MSIKTAGSLQINSKVKGTDSEKQWKQALWPWGMVVVLASFPLIAELVLGQGFRPKFFSTSIATMVRVALEVLLLGMTGLYLAFVIKQRAALVRLLSENQEQLESEVQQRTRKLAETGKWLRHILSDSPAVIYTARPDGDFTTTFISENLPSKFGYTQQDFLETGSSWFAHVHPEDSARVLSCLSKLVEDAEATFEYRLEHKDGTHSWLLDQVRLIRDKNGLPLEILGFSVDISDRKQAEEALRDSEARYRELCELLPQMVYEIDAEGRFTFTNRAGVQALGYSGEHPAPRLMVHEVLVADDRETLLTNIHKILDGGKTRGNRYRVVKRDGTTFPVITYANPIVRDGKVAGIRGVAVDVSDLAAAEERIRIDLKEKEVMLREIHHRVKNNLQVISSMLHLQAFFRSGKSVEEVIHELDRRIQAMALVHDHLHRSRDMAEINVREYLDGIVSSVVQSSDLTAGLITTTLDADDTITWGLDTAVHCGLIVNELLSNSFKHAFPEGREGRIEVSLHVAGDGKFELTVADDGVGIPEGINISEEKTLGMCIVHSLSSQLEADLELETARGTIFRFRFKEIRKG